MTRFRGHLRFANVMSLIALFIALGGTGYAAVKLPRNSVGASQIKTGGVGSSEVKNRSLRAGDFRVSDLPAGLQGPAGPQGEKGDKGDKGDPGPTNAPFPNATTQLETATTALADGATQTYSVFCPDGMQGISGAVRGDFSNSEFTTVVASRPAISQSNPEPPVDGGTFSGWVAIVHNPPGGAPPDGDLLPDVWVTCVPAPAA